MAGTAASAKASSTQDEKKATPTETVPEAMDFGVEGWRPVAGDTLRGTVEDITSGGSGSEFGRYPILILSTEDGGKVAVHAFHHTLKSRLLEMRPKVGHHVEITFHGEEPQYDRDGNPKIRNGQPMMLNQYTVTSPEFEFSWDAFA